MSLYFLYVYFLLFTGKFSNHKGRHRRFTNPEELEEQRKEEEKKRRYFRLYLNILSSIHIIAGANTILHVDNCGCTNLSEITIIYILDGDRNTEKTLLRKKKVLEREVALIQTKNLPRKRYKHCSYLKYNVVILQLR